jgi:hypothetical protein
VSWHPGARPVWVVAANQGRIPLVAEAASRPITTDDLTAEARAGLGLEPVVGPAADDPSTEALSVLVRALEEEADLHPVGRWLTRAFLVRLLQVRLQIEGYVREDPGVVDEVIEAPLVVTGAPRTGTTILFAVLASDPDRRAPEGWELLRPVPPPVPGEVPDPGRVLLADRELRQMATVVSGLDAIHVYGGRRHKECISAMSLAFLSEEFTARYHVPSYDRYLAEADMTPAYRAHRRVLQILQRQAPGTRWLLKSPVHLRSLDALRAVYPDARLAITHRDPMAVLPSLTSLVANLRWAHSDRVDFAEVGRYERDLWFDNLDGLARAERDGRLDGARTHHGHYADFLTDPLGATATLYGHFGWPLSKQTESAMLTALGDRPKDAHGVHDYSFADLDLDAAVERERFSLYQSTFAVPEETSR